MPSMHPWKFVFSGVDLIGAKMKNSGKVYESLKENYFQDLLISSGYFDDAPFTWISSIIHYGLKNEQKTHFGSISKKYDDLPITKELDMRVLLTADENDVDILMDFFKIAALDSLIEAGEKYKLNHNAIEILKKERSKLGQIPDWEYEMEDHPEIMLQRYTDSIGKPRDNSPKFVFGSIDRVSLKLGIDTKDFDNDTREIFESLQQNYFNKLLVSCGYYEKNAKFTFISCIINYEFKNESKTYFEGNNAKYADLTLSRVVDGRILLKAHENDIDMLTDFFKIAALDSLIEAGKKYKLNPNAIETLKKERSKLGQIPDWESQMEDHPEIMLEKYRKSVPKV